jgi:hypothetical protein
MKRPDDRPERALGPDGDLPAAAAHVGEPEACPRCTRVRRRDESDATDEFGVPNPVASGPCEHDAGARIANEKRD